MTSANSTCVGHVCNALHQSPLFQLSLASKELFHSNFLAWLCETYPDHAGRTLAAFLPQQPPTCSGLRAHRESHNIDLRLEYPDGGQLVVENKVKSIPRQEQLAKYAAKIRDKEGTSFLLLSLTRPPFLACNETSFRLSDGTVWRYLSYRELANNLQALLSHIEAANGYHGQLLRDYIDFITELDRLQGHFVIDWNDENGDFFGVQHELRQLKKIRVHDLVDKLRYSQLECRVAEVLHQEGFLISHERLPEGYEGRPGLVLVSSDMTRGVGLFNLEYLLMNESRAGSPVILGVQVQGNHFRLVVEVWEKNKNKSRAEGIAAALWQQNAGNRLWFDFRLLPDGSEEYPRKRDFNRYGGTFVYRSKRLNRISPKCLVDTIMAYARSIHRDKDAIRRRIDKIM